MPPTFSFLFSLRSLFPKKNFFVNDYAYRRRHLNSSSRASRYKAILCSIPFRSILKPRIVHGNSIDKFYEPWNKNESERFIDVFGLLFYYVDNY